MSTLHYADNQGNYIGGFGDGAKPPKNSVETPAPSYGRDKWDGKEWIPYDNATEKAEEELLDSNSDMPQISEEVIEILIAKGIIDITDFSTESRSKLVKRSGLRDQIKKKR